MTYQCTPADVALLRALASLARHQPETKRAAHLAGKAEELAKRMETDLNALTR